MALQSIASDMFKPKLELKTELAGTESWVDVEGRLEDGVRAVVG
jgi:hypothetical protein